MKLRLLSGAILFAVMLSPASATDWVSESLTASAKRSRCLDPEAASREARERVPIDSSNACRSKGYGWHLERVVAEGTLACDSCSEGKTQCQVRDMNLECRRLKPGSVGIMGVPFFGSHE
ncbi:hypothetical protein [Candidatus Methylocalor cossyra]|uniref:Uncharacterized protein n=1 Tax=Candidatus Methylocalor cossyra TaxID=3108543 RepID=A0ABM9NET8_9GAMM